MGKYSEALRKIEEERLKGKAPSSGSVVEPQGKRWKGYVIGILVFATIVLLAVYAHGVQKGMRAANILPLEKSAVEVPPPPAEKAEPAKLAESGKDDLLLNSLEGMMKLSYHQNPSVPEEQSTSSDEEPTPAPLPQNFYTIQLTSSQNVESARKEAKKLMDQGYQAIVLKSSKYYSVCVDKFENAAQAAERLTQLKDTFEEEAYQDAFVRFVRQG